MKTCVGVRKGLISIYLVFLFVSAGFMGFFILEDMVDDCSVDAATLKVGQGQTYSTIKSAIQAASAGDTIRVYAGTYRENFYINKSLSIIGNGSKNTIIQATGYEDCIRINSNKVSLSGFTVTQSSDYGIDIYYN